MEEVAKVRDYLTEKTDEFLSFPARHPMQDFLYSNVRGWMGVEIHSLDR